MNDLNHKPPRIERMDPAMVEVLRAKTGAERLQIAFDLWRTARELVRCAERRRHPELSEDELDRRVAELMRRGG